MSLPAPAVGAEVHSLAGRVVLITGGAGGIGNATAVECARRGADVALLDIRGAEEAAAALSKAFPVRSIGILCDVRSEPEVEAAVQRVVAELGDLHGALNAAGVESARGTLNETTFDDFNRIMSIHVGGTFLCTKAEINAMVKAGHGGSIVNVTSLAASVAIKGINVAYVTAKHGIMGMTKVAASENGHRGIRCNSVAPGFIHTPFFASLGRRINKSEEEIVDSLSTVVPMGRVGQAQEVARTVAFLLSDEASYISGANLPIDGAYLTTGRMNM